MSTEDDPAARLAAALARMDALINWERDRSQRIRLNLEPVRDVLERLGNPHRGEGAPKWVHVTGTKGKGSVVSLVAAGLARGGFRVGTYGSPHVERVNERVRIGGHEVADQVLAVALERALDARSAAIAAGTPGTDATWFDTLTAAAFCVFGEAHLEWVVCEVGLGGRLDSTNVIEPEVCVVTNIGLEHTHVLGSTHEEIAGEKAGILKRGASFVCGLAPGPSNASGPSDPVARAARVLLGRAADLGLEVVLPEGVRSGRRPEGFSELNRELASAVLDVLRDRGADPRLAPGSRLLDATAVRAAALPGRLERFDASGVPVVLDGAHVPESVQLALRELARDPALQGPPVVVLALAADKDAPSILKALGPTVDRVLCTTIETGRHLGAGTLCELATSEGLTATAVGNPEEAVWRAASLAASSWVLVTGSLYLAGAARTALRRATEC